MRKTMALIFFLSFPLLAFAEWTRFAPRDEIAPLFEQEDGKLILRSANHSGTNGHWRKTVSITGGTPYRFEALRKAVDVEFPRRSCLVRIEWKGTDGKPVTSPEKVNPAYFGTTETRARPEFPLDSGLTPDNWTTLSGEYLSPKDAVAAEIQLHLRWTKNGSVIWKDVSFSPIEKLATRNVVLAAVHHNLPGKRKTAAENRALFAPLIAKAAEKKADLIVLPELLTCKGVTHNYADLAEAVPGPTTDYFGKLARKFDCYIVAGFPERDGREVFNVAVLLGPDGNIVGKYRKTTLPREEIQQGISPGTEYPVFETRFGKVGMMICYDVFFPEVARELAARGAEIIALPIWGGNPRLAAARCAENGVYLVSSTYTDHHSNWMKTAVWNREGDRIVEATEWGTVVTATVDLNQRTYWPGLGDFQSRIAREAPVRLAEQPQIPK